MPKDWGETPNCAPRKEEPETEFTNGGADDGICKGCDGTGEQRGQLCKGCGGKGYL
jgi:hypothetical protein